MCEIIYDGYENSSMILMDYIAYIWKICDYSIWGIKWELTIVNQQQWEYHYGKCTSIIWNLIWLKQGNLEMIPLTNLGNSEVTIIHPGNNVVKLF